MRNPRRDDSPPVMLPELDYSPLSCHPGNSSPTDSDAIFTPFFDDDCLDATTQDSCADSYPDVYSLRYSLQHPECHHLISSPSYPLHLPKRYNHTPKSPPETPSNSATSSDTPLSVYGDLDPLSDAREPLTATQSLPARLSDASIHAKRSLDGRRYSSRFPEGHKLSMRFLRKYKPEEELGSGGYGFVMTARDRKEGHETAVKFIIKEKIPEQSWIDDEVLGRLPMEAVFLSAMHHENIVKCLDFYEDPVYYYLVQELHGSPWKRRSKKCIAPAAPPSSSRFVPPALSPSNSQDSLNASEPQPVTPQDAKRPLPEVCDTKSHSELAVPRPKQPRRPSHDLFEYIESSREKRLDESQARYIFRQVVDAIAYLHSRGVYHRDIKDENLVIDKDLKVKLIDFGSATFVHPDDPLPYHTLFYGTTAYAAAEILQKQPYQAPPAEVWTLGVLLSFLLTGASPFASVKDAIDGRISLADRPNCSREALHMLKDCLHPDPEKRATIKEVQEHPWLEMYQLS